MAQGAKWSWSDTEVHAILQAFTGRQAVRDRAWFAPGVIWGYRISELMSLKVKDVYDGEAGALRLFLLSFMAYFAGGFNARVQQRFIVLPGEPERVVLKHFGPSVVAATFDRTARSVSADYRLIAFDSNLGQFRFEQVGPLTPNKEAP